MREMNLLQAIAYPGVARATKAEHKRYPYLLGVELELENVSAAMRENGVRGWQMHVDDSLRNNGMEYVFAGPYAGDQAMQAVDNFYQAATGQRYTGGARTSTHVHVNGAGLTVGAFRFIVGLSYVLEDALFSSIKSYRRWCGYCMPLDAMHNSRLRALIKTDDPTTLALRGVRPQQNADKYYGLNVSSLQKHGTLEFRYFPGAPTKEELLAWMDYCTEIVRAGERLEDIDFLMNLETPEQLHALLAEHLPSWEEKLLAVAGIEPIFDKLTELQAVFAEEKPDGAQRKDPLLHVSPQLIGLACRIFGTNKATRDNIVATLSELKVLSRREWEESIVEARQSSESNRAGSKKKGLTFRRYAPTEAPSRVTRAADVIRPDIEAQREVIRRQMREMEAVAAQRRIMEQAVVAEPAAARPNPYIRAPSFRLNELGDVVQIDIEENPRPV